MSEDSPVTHLSRRQALAGLGLAGVGLAASDAVRAQIPPAEPGIGGTVTYADGTPEPNAEVYAVPHDNSLDVLMTTPDGNGEFSFPQASLHPYANLYHVIVRYADGEDLFASSQNYPFIHAEGPTPTGVEDFGYAIIEDSGNVYYFEGINETQEGTLSQKGGVLSGYGDEIVISENSSTVGWYSLPDLTQLSTANQQLFYSTESRSGTGMASMSENRSLVGLQWTPEFGANPGRIFWVYNDSYGTVNRYEQVHNNHDGQTMIPYSSDISEPNYYAVNYRLHSGTGFVTRIFDYSDNSQISAESHGRHSLAFSIDGSNLYAGGYGTNNLIEYQFNPYGQTNSWNFNTGIADIAPISSGLIAILTRQSTPEIRLFDVNNGTTTETITLSNFTQMGVYNTITTIPDALISVSGSDGSNPLIEIFDYLDNNNKLVSTSVSTGSDVYGHHVYEITS